MQDGPFLVILTETYPYPGPDDPFLTREIAALCEHARVLVVPTLANGAVPEDVPGHPAVDVSLAEELLRLSTLGGVRGLFSLHTFREARRYGSAGFRPLSLVTIARRESRAMLAKNWVDHHLLPLVRGQECIVYSWWGTAAAAGVSRALASAGVPFVCRMHGYDLYAEQERVGFVPFQADIMENATEVWTAAAAGAEYLRSRYPLPSAAIKVRPIGSLEVTPADRLTSPSMHQVVSCSSLIQVKRVDLLARALSDLAVQHPDLDFAWTHIGDGDLLADVRALCESLPGLQGRVTFTGSLAHTGVLEWLGSHRVDVFCNVSSSEGLPVTLMEAASAGIPLLALDVGGNGEVVDASNGQLLPADATSGQIARALASILTAPPDEVASMRQASRTRWQECFDGQRNYVAFAQRLLELAQVPTGRGQ